MRGLFGLLAMFAFSLLAMCITAQETQAQIFGRSRVQVNVGGGQRVQVNSGSGFRNNGAQVNVFNNGGARVNSFNHGSRNNGANINVFNGSSVPFIPNSVRVNSFGSATTFDRFGNVFEVNAFGQPVIRSSGFRGFAVSPFAAPGCF